MTRMARTQSNIRGATNGLAGVRTQNFNQSVSEVQSESAGLDSFRGDLTNAFNQFFGSINNSIQSVQNTQFEIEKRKASDFAADMKARATTEATDYYVNNPKSRDVNTALETEDQDLQSNRHFVNTYKQTLGSNIGSRLYSDFTASQANKNPASFESNAQAFWNENYQDGTGDPMVDLAMQDSWNRNYENNRIGAAQETIRRQRAAANLEHVRNVYRTLQDGGITIESLNATLTGGPSNGRSAGQITAGNVGIALEAAQNMSISANDATVIQTWMDMVPTGPNGETGQSISQRFPRMAAKFEAALPSIRARSATLEGMEVAEGVMNDFSAAMATSDEVEKAAWLTTEGPASLERLRNTPGVSSGAITTYRTEMAKASADSVAYATSASQYERLAAGMPVEVGASAPETDQEIKAYSNTFDGLSPSAQGDMLRNTVINYGKDAVPAPVMNRIRSVLAVGTAEQKSEMFGALIQATGFGSSARADIADALLPDDMSRAIYNSIQTNSLTMPQSAAIAQATSMDYTNARMLFEERGGDNAWFGGADGKDEDVQDNLYGEAMEDQVLSAMGNRTWFNDVQMDSNTQALILSTAREVGTQLALEGFTPNNKNTVTEMQKRVAAIVGPQLARWGDTITTGQAYSASANRDAVRLAPAVTNPITGNQENTLENLQNDLETLDGGLRKRTDIDDATYSLVADSANQDQNLFTVRANGQPVSFVVGETVYTDPRYNEDGERLGVIGNITNWNTSIELTGDLQADREAMATTLGPGIILMPDYVNGTLVGYHLAAKPRFEEAAAYTLEEREERFNAQANFERFNPVFNNEYPNRTQQQQNLNAIPDDWWDTEEGQSLQNLIDNDDPRVPILVQDVARQFD